VVNIPSSLQSAWDGVAGDGKIDKDDFKKLVEAAAPGITTAKTAKEYEKLVEQIDPEENDFLAKFASTQSGSEIAVKNGSARGTFEFVNEKSPEPTTKAETPKEKSGQFVEYLKLPDGDGQQKVAAGTADNNPQIAAIEERLKKLQILKNSLPSLVTGEQLTEETAKITAKIKKLEETLVTVKSASNTATLADEINTIVNNAIAGATAEGNKGLLEDAGKYVEKAIAKYSEIEKDPAKVAALKKEVTGKLQTASQNINDIKQILDKPNLGKQDIEMAESLIAKISDGTLKTKLSERVKTQPELNKKVQDNNRANIKTTLEGLHDVIGNGFWNAENAEGTGAMFQLLAVQGLLEETVKKLNHDDQTEAIKILLKSDSNFNHGIAAWIYEIASKSANINDEIGEKSLNLFRTLDSKNLNASVEPEQFIKGIHYSLKSEPEAAMTMARGIINRDIDSHVLTKFSKSDLASLVELVNKKGTEEEKDTLAKVIAESYAGTNQKAGEVKSGTVQIDHLSKSAKAKIVKEVLSAEQAPDDAKIKAMVKQMGKSVIFEAVNKEDIPDNQLANLARFTNGDDMADNQDAAVKLLLAMIREYNRDQKGTVSLDNINTFIDQVDKDWWDDDDIMKKVLRELKDGPESDYARFKALAPQTMDKIWKISD
jgi:hypothetical protein